MRVLITGSTGQVGHHLVEEATARGWEVVAPTRTEFDLSSLASLRTIDLEGIDGVLHPAAYTAVDAAEEEEGLAQRINGDATGELATACAAANIPLVVYSTDYVFNCQVNAPYTEENDTSPLGVYGCTKREGEERVINAKGAYAILRLSWVFSAHGKNFVKTMMRLGKEHGAVRVVDDQIGCPTPAKAAAKAGVIALDQLRKDPNKSGIYHFTSDEPVSWAGFAKSIFETAQMDVPVTPITTAEFPTPAARPAYSVMDTQKIQTVLRIPPANWRAGLAEVIAQLLSEEGGVS